MLLALKTNSARSQDMRDILALCYEKPQTRTVVALLEKCPRDQILENLRKLEAYLSIAKPDSFRSMFSANPSVLKRSIEHCESFLAELWKSLKT